MITTQDIIDIMPDDILIQITGNTRDDTTINTSVIDKTIAYAQNYFAAVLPNLEEEVQDELLLNFVINKLYLYAGATEQAMEYYKIYNNILKTYTNNSSKGEGSLYVKSDARIFTDEEFEKW